MHSSSPSEGAISNTARVVYIYPNFIAILMLFQFEPKIMNTDNSNFYMASEALKL